LQHDEARKKIAEVLEQKIGFEGHFDKCFDNLKDTQQNELITWVKNCGERHENPIQSRKDRNIIGFVRKFGSNLRAILTKEKESYFICLFLDKHKYYDTELMKLGF
jgi:hypothetical protein